MTRPFARRARAFLTVGALALGLAGAGLPGLAETSGLGRIPAAPSAATPSATATPASTAPAFTAPASADCTGRDLMSELPAADRDAIRASADATPFSRGILWQATRGDQRIVIVGTYHFGDPRHQATLTRLRPEIARAASVLVEAGPDEERRLGEALRADPTLMTDPAGSPLHERLSPRDWQRLTGAMAARGLPVATTEKLRPWYLATMLGLSPCMLRQVAEGRGQNGLDHMLIDAAEAAGVPVRALEPWNTLFSVFAGMTPQEETDMIRSALPQAEEADDYAYTLTEGYFAGELWQLWEFGRYDAYRKSGLDRPEVDALMDLTRRKLMDTRNQSWIAPLTQAAAEAARQDRSVVAGFGALHLPGEQGVLNLLQQQGWTVSPLGQAPRPLPRPERAEQQTGAPT